MKHKFHLLFVTVLLLLITVLVTAQEGGPEPLGIRPDAPQYALHGPYWVGFASQTITDGNGRPLDAFIWYPALNTDNMTEQITYALPYLGDEAALGHALADAEPNFNNGPYPLVIYSHGLNGFRLTAPYLVEHLASYGFVVMAVDHEDNIGAPDQPMYPSFVSRPADVSRQIDYAEMLTAEGSTWAGLIDVEHVAVVGHSFGGSTALAAGGARLDWASWAEFCQTNPEGDPLGTCDQLMDHFADMAMLAGWDTVPESPWPTLGDARVDAVVPLAPAGRFFGAEGVRDMTVPALFMGGTHDMFAIPEFNLFPLYEALTSQKTLVEFEQANHLIFHPDCSDVPWMLEMGISFYCSDPVWDMDRAHDLTNHFVTAFLLAEFYGDVDAAAALASENVQFPGVTYETTEF